MIDLLPAWATELRPGQQDAIDAILDAYHRGIRLVILDAPTGAGKTLIAEAVRLSLGERGCYIPHTKSLQHQFLRDFTDSAVLMGRVNYPCPDAPLADITADDCTGDGCAWCPKGCAYIFAREDAEAADCAVLNTAYFLTVVNGQRHMFSGRGLGVIDECDTLESELMRYVGTSLTPRRLQQLGLKEIGHGGITKPEAWISWVDQAIPSIRAYLDKMPKTARDPDARVKLRRSRRSLQKLLDQLKLLEGELAVGDWVYTGKNGYVEFKPVRVDRLGAGLVWGHARRWLLMSATVVSPDEMVESLGWEDRWELVTMPSRFPVARRPIHVVPVAEMSRRGMEADGSGIVRTADAIAAIYLKHDCQPMLVHAVSYDLAKRLTQMLDGPYLVHTYHSSIGRDLALDSFKAYGGILIAPSLDRGVDLPDDLCRVVVIVKVPYPYLGDRQVSARLHDGYAGQLWYNVQTVRSVVQMSGRGMRHQDDWCATYILDSGFVNNLWKKASGLFPTWWAEALDWRTRL